MKSMNPNVASMFKTTKEAKHNSKLFRAWLSKHPEADVLIPRLDEIEAEYKVRMMQYNSKLPYYAKKFNINDYFKDYDWTFKGFK